MGVIPDWALKDMGICTPLAEGKKRPGKISYGVTSYGYDARIGNKFQIFDPTLCPIIDPKNFDRKALREVVVEDGESIMIPPNSFVLGETVEEFIIPRDCLCLVIGKSTYARCGLIVNVTPGEPEWKGKWTVEISNTTPVPVKVYAGEGIMQTVFIRTDLIRSILGDLGKSGYEVDNILRTFGCEVSYADKGGKYQNQEGLTLPTVDSVSTTTRLDCQGLPMCKWDEHEVDGANAICQKCCATIREIDDQKHNMMTRQSAR